MQREREGGSVRERDREGASKRETEREREGGSVRETVRERERDESREEKILDKKINGKIYKYEMGRQIMSIQG